MSFSIFDYTERFLLERGSRAEIWCAVDRELNRPVALKGVPREDRQSLEQEARMSEQVQRLFPQLASVFPQVYGSGSEGDKAWLVMELVEGCPLNAAVPLPQGLVAREFRKLVRALGALHQSGFVHGDLCSRNLLVTASGEWKLLNLRLAQKVGELWKPKGKDKEKVTDKATDKATDKVTDNGNWQAPEQLQGAEIHWTAQVYSLGKLLELSLRTSSADQEFANSPWFSFVQTCLRESAEERFQTPAEMLEALENLLPKVFEHIPIQEQSVQEADLCMKVEEVWRAKQTECIVAMIPDGYPRGVLEDQRAEYNTLIQRLLVLAPEDSRAARWIRKVRKAESRSGGLAIIKVAMFLILLAFLLAVFGVYVLP